MRTWGRRAKYFLFHLRDTRTLIVHLRMTGSLRVVESSEEMHRYTQTVFHFEDGYDLRFVDMRKFGAVWLVDDAESVVGGLGPEPLEPSFTPEVLEGIVEGRNTVIKLLLMDQKRIAGIGNIYADDILFRSGVHPQTPAKKLGAESIGAIHDSIVVILTRAIEMLTARMPLDKPPTEALGDEIFLVPRKSGASCPGCTGEIQRMVVGGRGDLFLSGLSGGGCCVDKCLMASEGDHEEPVSKVRITPHFSLSYDLDSCLRHPSHWSRISNWAVFNGLMRQAPRVAPTGERRGGNQDAPPPFRS